MPGGVCFAAEGAGGGRGAQSAVSPGGDCQHGETRGYGRADAGDQRAHGGYVAEGAGAVSQASRGHSDYDGRECVAAADVGGGGGGAVERKWLCGCVLCGGG